MKERERDRVRDRQTDRENETERERETKNLETKNIDKYQRTKRKKGDTD